MLRRFGSRKENTTSSPAPGGRDRSAPVTSAAPTPKKPQEFTEEYETLLKSWKDIAHMMEELPKVAGSTKAAGAAAGSARRDVQDTVRVCGQQLLADLAMPFSLGSALVKMGNVMEGVNDKRFEGERDLPDSIMRFANEHLQKTFPALKRAVDDAAREHAHYQSCVKECEGLSNTSDHHRIYSAAQAKYAAQHRYECRLSSALELLSATLASCENDIYKLLLQAHSDSSRALTSLSERLAHLRKEQWDELARFVAKLIHGELLVRLFIVVQRKDEYPAEKQAEADASASRIQQRESNRWMELIEILSLGLADALLMTADGEGKTVELVARSLDAYERSYDLMLEVISNEVETTSSPATLLRENNFASKMTIGYLKLITHNYISPITDIIAEVLADPTAYEVDPKKVPEGADVEGNMERLVAASTAFLDVVVNSIENAPKVLRQLLKHLYDKAEKKWDGKGYTAVGGFLFLRLICPALVFPEKNNLLADPSASVSGEGRRGLMLVSKALQNLANGKKFREEYMDPLNEWFDANQDKLRGYLEEIIVVPDNAPVFTLASVEEVNDTDIPQLVKILVEHMEPICTRLERSHKDLIARTVAALGAATEWVDVENPTPAPKQ